MSLRREISKALRARGFEHHAGFHRLRLPDGFSFLVDTGPLGDGTDVAPWVLIRHDEVERLRSELMNVGFNAWAGHIGGNVGYINGDGYQCWDDPADKEDVLRAIDRAMDRLRPFLSLDRFNDAWDASGDPNDYQRVFREVPILMLQGADTATILRKLDEARPHHVKHAGPVGEQFREFEARVRRRLAERNRR